MRKIIFIVPISVLLLFGCSSPKILSIRENDPVISSPISTNEVSIVSEHFIPDQISINQGEIVKITNHDAKVYTILSDPHPTHDQIPSLYDVIYKNETKTIEFQKSGSFGVHLEENPSINLKIVVE